MKKTTFRVLIDIAGVGSSYVMIRATSEKAARKAAVSTWGGKVLSCERPAW